MRSIILSAAMGVGSMADAQTTFENTYGGTGVQFGYNVVQTLDDGYALFGATGNGTAESVDMYLVKTNAEGTEEWSRTYGSVNADLGFGGIQTSDGGYILCGMFNGYGSDTLTLVRTDANGGEIWTQQYPGTLGRDIGYSVEETFDGGFIVCGFTQGDGTEEDVFLVRTLSNGDPLWTSTVDLGGSEVGWTLRQTNDNGFVVLANSFTFADPDGDLTLLRFDENGDTLWTSTIVSPGPDESHGLDITADGGFIIAGGNGYPDRDILLVRTDDLGQEQWRRTYVSDGDQMALDIEELGDGSFIATGRKEETQTQDIQMHLFRTDATGSLQWERTFQHGIFSEANSLAPTSDGGFVVLGSASTVLGTDLDVDMYLVKTDGAGYASVALIQSTGPQIITYPNPATDRLWIDAGTGRIASVAVVDAARQLVIQQSFSGAAVASIDVQQLANGVYTLVTSTADGNLARQGILIAR